MTYEQMMSLSKDDKVITIKSRKPYRVTAVCRAGEGWKHDGVLFVQQRDGRDYGPERFLKAENIERA